MPVLTDVEWIFVILAALYLFESLVWVRPGVVPLVSSWGGFTWRRRVRRLTGNDQGDLILSGLAPFDVTLLLEALPLSFSDDGVVAFVAASPLQSERPQQAGLHFTWDQLTVAIASGRSILVGDQLLCMNRSERAASRLAAQLRRLARCTPEDRPLQIEAWRSERFDVVRAGKRISAWEESTLAIRIGATLLLFWIGPLAVGLCYGWLPVSPDAVVMILYLVMLFALWWSTSLLGVLSHRYLYPGERLACWTQAVYSLLSPAVPLRLADSLGRELFDFEHPLAVSAAVDSPEQFRAVAELVMRDALYPRLPEEPAEGSASAQAIIHKSRQADLQQLQQIIAAQGFDHQTILDSPRSETAQSLSYCPRCLSDFVIPASRCEPCGNRQTIAYTSRP